jgi:hypothetical protein
MVKNKNFETPVVFIVFNRPLHTQITFEAIRLIRPTTLFLVADGPRVGNFEDQERCKKVKDIITKIDWPTKVYQIFSESNLGCKKRIITGLNYVFDIVDSAIILEDDCLPHPDFFDYCSELLIKYSDNNIISMISGNNFQGNTRRGDYSYYFSRYAHVWGWATWKRSWLKNNSIIDFWPKYKKSNEWKYFFKDNLQKKYWENIFNMVYEKRFETTWDYPWIASIWYNGGLTITPNVNLVTNIGIGPESTHTYSETQKIRIPLQEMKNLTHPAIIEINYDAEKYTYDNEYGGKYKRFPIKYYHQIKAILKKIIIRVSKKLIKT